MSRGLYIHVPFCLEKCSYCDFYSVPKRNATYDSFLTLLEQEMKLRSDHQAVDTVFFGGGTPSLLSSDAISAVLNLASRFFHVSDSAEITMEANPGTLDCDYLRRCREAGVNRLSLGIQTLEPRLLELLGRRHSVEDAMQAVEAARQAGFFNISCDLIYGLPSQTLGEWEATLSAATRLSVNHLSLYALEIHEDTPLGLAVQRGEVAPAEDDLVADMYDLARKYLNERGLRQYEISNFCRPSFECKHNLIYWSNEEYIGLGPAACSYLAGERACNIASLASYSELLGEGKLPSGQAERLSLAETEAETMMLGLRLTSGVDGHAFFKRFGRTIEQAFGSTIQRLLAKEWLVPTDNGYALPSELVPVANIVLTEFVR